jgi:hypothetical protein
MQRRRRTSCAGPGHPYSKLVLVMTELTTDLETISK